MGEVTHLEKVCTECMVSKSLSEYRIAKRGKHGRAAICKPCAKSKYRPSHQTAEWKAQYARRKLGVTCTYIPQAKRNELAENHRAEREALRAQQKLERKKQRAAARDAFKAAQHDAHVRVFRSRSVQWRLKYHGDNVFALTQRLRTQIRKKSKLYPRIDSLMRDALKRNGRSPMVEAVCGYSIQELAAHLARQFVDGMDWDSFRSGKIHIDHRRPQASFDLNDIDQVRACWALSNLQPLWAADNLAKGARWDGRSARGRSATVGPCF